MLFNSVEFIIFLPVVFCLYWCVSGKRTGIQNGVLLGASYFFYGWWDWRFLSLIGLSSAVDYLVGLGLGRTSRRPLRTALLWVSLLSNLGLLGFFKYYNFFADNFSRAFQFLGRPVGDSLFLNIVLPVGISFYTFQTMSYSIDLYRGRIQPEKNPVSFFTFVSFFPQLVAGPIERATQLLPQFSRVRRFEYDRSVDGLRQILWGFFKKVVIADNCAGYVNDIFTNYSVYSGSTLVLGALIFSVQIYADFSGYSDIAIGTSRLFGFSLMRNFHFPYFSRNIPEFWRRWHISLSTWFRDYLYIPLGGNRGSLARTIRNICIVFLVSGFWHGANWTFIVWGGLHGLFFLPYLLKIPGDRPATPVSEGHPVPWITRAFQTGGTFFLVSMAWIFFRSGSVGDALAYIHRIFSFSLFTLPVLPDMRNLMFLIGFIGLLFGTEWLCQDRHHALEDLNEILPVWGRWPAYALILFLIVVFGTSRNEFIYFQF